MKRNFTVSRQTILRLLSALVWTVTSLSLTACLRYVPPRDEISSEAPAELSSPEEFTSFENDRQAKKQQFVEQRTAQFADVKGSTYTLGPGDVVDIQVFGLSDLSGPVRVRPSGVVSMPLLGEIKVEGLSEAEAEQLLEQRLKSYVKTPRVKVSIPEYQAHRVSVVGAVVRPGNYPLRRSDYGLLDVLSEAGGCTDRSAGLIVLVPESQQSVGMQNQSRGGIEFEKDEIYGNGGQKAPLMLPLMDGDTVLVPEAGTYEVTGEVKNPGSFPLTSRTSVMRAIAAAGGLEYSADVGKVELIRNIGGGKLAVTSFNLEQRAVKDGKDTPLRNGDVVRVPSQEGRYLGRQIVEMVHGLFSVGVSSN